MLHAVPHRRRSLTAQRAKLSSARARNDDVGLRRHAILERARTLKHEAARFSCNLPDDPLEADERGRAIAAVHHQVCDVPLAREVTGESHFDSGPRELWKVLAFAIGLFVPILDGESGIRDVLHARTSALCTW